jgi:hypothetical protein
MLQRWPPHQGRSRETGDPRMRCPGMRLAYPSTKAPTWASFLCSRRNLMYLTLAGT